MRTLWIPAVVLLALVGVLLFGGSVLALEIQVAPATLVLSSGGGQVTIHADVPYRQVEAVSLEIDGKPIEKIRLFADDCGDLVVQVSKEAVAKVIGSIKGQVTTVSVKLTVDGESGSAVLRVRK